MGNENQGEKQEIQENIKGQSFHNERQKEQNNPQILEGEKHNLQQSYKKEEDIEKQKNGESLVQGEKKNENIEKIQKNDDQNEESSINDEQIQKFVQELEQMDKRQAKIKQQQEDNIWKGIKSVKLPEKPSEVKKRQYIQLPKIIKNINIVALEKVSKWQRQRKQIEKRRWDKLENEKRKREEEIIKESQEAYHDKKRQQEQKKIKVLQRLRQMEERRHYKEYLQQRIFDKKADENFRKNKSDVRPNDRKVILKENSFRVINKKISNQKLQILEDLKQKQRKKRDKNEKEVLIKKHKSVDLKSNKSKGKGKRQAESQSSLKKSRSRQEHILKQLDRRSKSINVIYDGK